MRVLDLTNGQEWRYLAGWQIPVAPEEPSGGTTVDIEARTAIVALINALRSAGIFGQP
jgi:hypothetical protein